MTQWAELPKNFGTIKLSSPQHQPACGCIDCMIAHAAAKETTMPKMTQTEQHQLRETTLNMLGQQVERIESAISKLTTTTVACRDTVLMGVGEKYDRLSAKLDTLQRELHAAQHDLAQDAEHVHGDILRRIDKLDHDLRKGLFETVAAISYKAGKKKGKKRK